MKLKKKTHKVEKYVGFAFSLILLPFFILMMSLFILSITSDKAPCLFGYTPLIVQSGSMSPAFEVGDVVIVKNTEKEENLYPVDQIICFESNEKKNTFITHRIIKQNIENDSSITYNTQGDANNTPDKDKVTFEQILGPVVGSIPDIGFFLLEIQQPKGMILYVVLPIVLIFGYITVLTIIDFKAEAEEKKQKALEEQKRMLLEEIRKEQNK